jgi:hypothetical protein
MSIGEDVGWAAEVVWNFCARENVLPQCFEIEINI